MRLDPEIERRCAAFAERHFGYLPRTTALGLGHTDETLEARVANGTFDHPAASLFRYAGASRCWRGDIYAAVAAGPTVDPPFARPSGRGLA